MGYLKGMFDGSGPLDFARDSFILIHAWLSDQKVNPDEAEYLADMTRKVDWSDHVEKDEFVQLMEYLSRRSSLSEDLSWGAVVCYGIIAIGFPLLFCFGVILYVVNASVDDGGVHCSQFCMQFISSRGNEYFCEIDEDYLTDRFNLTGLNTDVQYYQYALDLVTDVFDLDCDDDMREQIEKSARHLYGLVHARYITTTRGLAKMLEKYKKGDFGKCPRVMCNAHPLLPTGMADLPHVQSVKLYCGKCEDLYNPKSSRHANIDGAYFGTSFQNILFQVYPALIPEKTIERYQPRIFGFKVHAAAALERWQSVKREEMQERLKDVGMDKCFKEDVELEDDMEDDEEEVAGMDGADDVLAE